MSYTAGVFYVDLENGSDTARSAITSCTASNPSGSTVRITTPGAHGLVKGAVVDLTLFSSWLNAPWKITVVDSTSFDLDGATWQATADPDGTVTPRGGSSWTDAWRTCNSKTLIAGDTVRFAKSGDPVLIGTNGAWTAGSADVTFTPSLPGVYILSECDTNWTAGSGGDVTPTVVSSSPAPRKGSGCVKCTFDSSVQTSKLQAYMAVGLTVTLTKISFWLYSTAAQSSAGKLRLALCSDAVGAVPVDWFDIPIIRQANVWMPVSILRSGGSASYSVGSIALYTDASVTGLASTSITFDNIIASSGIDHHCLVSKSSSASVASGEGWYAIRSFSTGSVTLDMDTGSTSVAGWYLGPTGLGTETVPTYYRQVAAPYTVNSAAITGTYNGTAANNIAFTGGWNTALTDTQDGVTFFSGLGATTISGINLGSCSYVNFSRLCPIRWQYGAYFLSVSYLTLDLPETGFNLSDGLYVASCSFASVTLGSALNNNSRNVMFSSSNRSTLVSAREINGAAMVGLYVSGGYHLKVGQLEAVNGNRGDGVTVEGCPTFFSGITKCASNAGFGVSLAYGSPGQNVLENADIRSNASGVRVNSGHATLRNVTTGSNTGAGLRVDGGVAVMRTYNCTINESTEVQTGTGAYEWIATKHDGTLNNDRLQRPGWSMTKQNATRHTASGYAWTATMTQERISDWPHRILLGNFYLPSGSAQTVKVWVKKSSADAATISAALECSGVPNGSSLSVITGSTTTATIDWQELSITVTSTLDIVLPVYVLQWGTNGGSIILDDVTPPTGVDCRGLDYMGPDGLWADNSTTGAGVATTVGYGFFGG